MGSGRERGERYKRGRKILGQRITQQGRGTVGQNDRGKHRDGMKDRDSHESETEDRHTQGNRGAGEGQRWRETQAFIIESRATLPFPDAAVIWGSC